ncbi:hypothetical protein KIKIMORA_05170 [Brevundimonas phage vB_BpoS-Kikimora]|uniref:Uncharacterized protein n=1 Tax=Brevundimonas phage vB_BpoS-Kikimora TaxID=2948601 RepID=A0A9E7MT79_9CAUD|nr:hypothetical protein KIKIMORA_05170 [Brevundimonas phage vB_BpoS-Kikimora]
MTQVQAALRRLTAWRSRPRSGPIPGEDGSISWTADHLVDDPREPIMTPTGVLDSRGQMLVRVRVPIKVKMGFHLPHESREPDEVETIVPEDLLAVSDCGMGVESLTPEEADDGDGDDEDAPPPLNRDGLEENQVRLSDVLRTLTHQGVEVVVDVEFAEAPS